MVDWLRILLITSLAWSAAPAPASPWQTSGGGVLVLRNGQILQGRITAAGDKYIVTLGRRSEVRIPRRDVEMVCTDLEEVYRRRRAGAGRAGGPSHRDLAEWCLRHGLLSHAADELLAAYADDPDDPRIAALERRLQAAVNKPIGRLRDGRTPRTRAHGDRLQRTLGALPAGAMEAFTAQIQPLLLNHCGAAACHGIRSPSDLRLIRPSWGKSLSQRCTQHNLHSVLQQVDLDHPADSPLLAAPGSPHGPVAAGVFSETSRAQFELLKQWVLRVASPAHASPPDGPPLDKRVVQASYHEEKPMDAGAEMGAQLVDDTARRGARKAKSADMGRAIAPLPNSGYAPRDPFDPEVFNQRFLRPSAGPAPAGPKPPPIRGAEAVRPPSEAVPTARPAIRSSRPQPPSGS